MTNYTISIGYFHFIINLVNPNTLIIRYPLIMVYFPLPLYCKWPQPFPSFFCLKTLIPESPQNLPNFLLEKLFLFLSLFLRLCYSIYYNYNTSLYLHHIFIIIIFLFLLYSSILLDLQVIINFVVS